MKKTVKNYGMILGMSIALTTVGVVVDAFRERRKRQRIEAEDERSGMAFLEFLRWNGLDQKDITYVTDSGYTPIYAYCGESFDPEKARIPKGYVLHKLMHSSGAVNYAYGLELGSEDVFPDYRVLFYLDKRTTKDWDIDIASEF